MITIVTGTDLVSTDKPVHIKAGDIVLTLHIVCADRHDSILCRPVADNSLRVTIDNKDGYQGTLLLPLQ